MEQYIPKSALIAEIKERIEAHKETLKNCDSSISEMVLKGSMSAYQSLLYFLDTLEVKDPYEQCIQYPTVRGGIEAHAETYSFNIESELFNQLTKEQQKLWRKEIEQAVISGGEIGVEFARDPRYKENLEVNDVDLEEEIILWANVIPEIRLDDVERLAKYFFELGLKTQKGE